jgi:hypothetical protein
MKITLRWFFERLDLLLAASGSIVALALIIYLFFAEGRIVYFVASFCGLVSCLGYLLLKNRLDIQRAIS